MRFLLLAGVAACADHSATHALCAQHGQGDDFYALPSPHGLHRNAEGPTHARGGTARVHAPDRSAVDADADCAAMTAANAPAWYAPLFAYLATNSDHVVDAAVFTTQHATNIGAALRKGVFGTPAPVG